ncbi:hypothetical protein SZ25_00052 [Candidatus Arcanobacter lacustris]|jgi:hypothetical protein|uniref:Toxin HigB-2 n=1 Tax=Candidatus Arcanibacter lacustris TaxID=1607817 RepID=A0A0F5MQ76_9RICK|nr:hypothetical protein SZ25_00052 [Candidatus Arcanobacter lacustris]
MTEITLDMNCPEFQESLFSLEKDEQRSILNTLKKISKLSWDDLHMDKGLRWELINSKKTSKGEKLYSFRFSKKYRALAYRDKNYLVLLGLFTDHDGAYL